MFCPKCGKELREYERSCPYCGAIAKRRRKRQKFRTIEIFAIAVGALALILAGFLLAYQFVQWKKTSQQKTMMEARRETAAVFAAETLARPRFLHFLAADSSQLGVAVPDYSVSAGLHEVTNLE